MTTTTRYYYKNRNQKQLWAAIVVVLMLLVGGFGCNRKPVPTEQERPPIIPPASALTEQITENVIDTAIAEPAESSVVEETQPQQTVAQAPKEVKLSDLIADMASNDAVAQQKSQKAWQDICMEAGAPGSAALLDDVNKQAVEQLGRDIPIAVKILLLREIAWTGDASVVPTVAAFLNAPEERIREEAVMALAVITAPESADALKKALADATDAADQKRIEDALASKNISLTVVVEKKMPMALADASDEVAQEYLAGFAQIGNDEKCLALAALTARNDKKYRQYARDAVKSDDDALKRAGLLALEKLGTSEDVPLLIDSLDFDGDLIVGIASHLVDDQFDEVLLNAIRSEQAGKRFEALGRILANRHVAAVCGILLAEAKKDDCPNRLGHLQIAADVATKSDVGNMLEVMTSVKDARERDRAETIIAGICRGDAEPVIAGSRSVPPTLFSLLGRIGGDESREIITNGLKSDNAAVRDAALNGLCNWPNATAANEMLAFAKDTNMPATLRTRALRAYVRVVSLPDDRIGITISGTGKLDGLKEAMKLATGTPEKQLIIDRAKAIRIPESVTFAMQYMGDPAVSQTVCSTVTELGRNIDLRRNNADVLRPALEKVLEVSTDNNLKDNVRRYLGDM